MSAPFCGTWPTHKSFEITSSRTRFSHWLLLSDPSFGGTQAQDEVIQSTFFAEQRFSGLSQVSWILHLRSRGHLFTFGNPRHMLKQVPWLLACECFVFFFNGHRLVESPFYICKTHSPLFRHLQSYKEWVPVFSRLNTLPVVNSCLRAQSSKSAGWIIVVLQN